MRTRKMLHATGALLGMAVLLALAPTAALALGTAAGSAISNRATATYTIGSLNLSASSGTVTTTVSELLDVSVIWQDGANVAVLPSTTGQYLTFRVTNTGNGDEDFNLVDDPTVAGGFDPFDDVIYVDDGDGAWDTGDAVYAGPLALAADTSRTLFVVCDIPGGLADGELRLVDLTATSVTGSGAPGTVVAGGGTGGTDAVVGASGGTGTATGTFEAVVTAFTLTKTAVYTHPTLGNGQPLPGATITYTITATVVGSGTALGVTVSDPVPANTTFVSGSITVNGTPTDDDPADGAGISGGVITVDLGDLSAGTTTITFETVID